MANRLKAATVHSILTLRQRGWSYRRIARELGIHRETVARYVRLTADGVAPPLASQQRYANARTPSRYSLSYRR